MKKVKLSFPPEKWDIEKHSPNGSCVWGDYEFFLNQEIEECDYWLVCENMAFESEKTIVYPENVILSESADIDNYSKSFLSKFNYVYSYKKVTKHKNLIKSIPIIPWFVKMNYDELNKPRKIEKYKAMSLLTSDKKISINHIKRLNFVKKINKYFGEAIDIHGPGFTDHVYDKKIALEPYMNSIILESFEVPDYFSEKLGDCYLFQTFPVYNGCTNLEEYFNFRAYERINMHDFSTSVKIIKQVLDSKSLYQEKIEFIYEAKNKYLNSYSIFPIMANILDNVQLRNGSQSTHKELISIFKFNQNNVLAKIKNKITTKTYDFLHKT